MDHLTDDTRLAHAFTELTREDDGPYPPFRWQQRLLRRLIDADLPKAVDVPTGLGKTSVMALWLIALSEGANLPRRLVYVVDRRAVVDQATRFANLLRANMPGSLAHALQLNGGLPISTLRGGFADNRDWLEDPSKPAIIVGTIDMIGSRLLFEGYGVSDGMRPYHAGLLGVDALVLLDEAHLCTPFEALLRQVEAQRDGALGPSPDCTSHTPPFHLMSLSATGRDLVDMAPDSVFRLEPDDTTEPVVRQRMTAGKRLMVTELTDERALTDSLASRAIELGEHTHARVLVYCNSRNDAVQVKQMIDKEYRQRQRAGCVRGAHESELLVGERRVYERSTLENWLARNGLLGGAASAPDRATFLVATSAGEVGVDLDADHLVCDLVAYERMVQRLGRVNRRGGESRIAMIDVFAARPELRPTAGKAERANHAEAVARFERRLAALSRLPRGEDDRHDASLSATSTLKSEHPKIVHAATTRAPLHPELTRPLLDAWAMTSLRRHEGRPEVAPWLRGWEPDEEPQTTVVWRKYLPYVVRPEDTTVPPGMVVEFFRNAPIHATERLEAASSRVLDWLLKRTSRVGRRDPNDVEGLSDKEIAAILVDRRGDHIESATFSELQYLGAPAKSLSSGRARQRDRRKREWKERHLPGATLVVDARICGLRDGMLDEKSNHDVATADSDVCWQALREDASEQSSRPLIRFRVQEIVGLEEGEGVISPTESAEWRHTRTFETHFDAGGGARRGLAVCKWADDATDEASRSILSAPQTLQEHTEQVMSRVREIATRLDLRSELEAYVIAARLHDVGKDAERWQSAMNAPADGRPYAKTLGGGNWRLMEGYRHEFGSLVKAECHDMREDFRDLVLHLIATHHGNARPLISSAGCQDAPPSELECRAGEAALRFVRLQKRFGPWGLAWREAILRAADQSVSREWSQRQREKQGDG